MGYKLKYLSLFNVENIRLMNKLVNDYVNFAKECWVHASVCITRPTEDCDAYLRALASSGASRWTPILR